MKISYFNCMNGKNITHFRECFKSLINDDMVFACVGTDAVILDSLGPMVGTMLKKRNPNINIYGTLDDPITGLNIRSKVKTIKKNHPNAVVIAIDACMVCDTENIHDVYLLNKPLKPGGGIDRTLPKIGNYTIKGATTHVDNQNLSNGRMRYIYNMAEQIVDIIIDSL